MTSWSTSRRGTPNLGRFLNLCEWGGGVGGGGRNNDYWACLLGMFISILPCVIRDVILIKAGRRWGLGVVLLHAGGRAPLEMRARVWRLGS